MIFLILSFISEQEFASLRSLLAMDPEDVGTTEFEFHRHFDQIATYLFNSVALVVNNRLKYRLVEIEFYLKGGPHQDMYAHCNKDQKTCGEWYFHKQKEGYKGGTYKGLDITFGAKDVPSSSLFLLLLF